MITKEIKNFREDYAISIQRFLQINVYVEHDILNTRRVKHSEIAFLPLVIPVSMNFAKRYEKEFVVNGKILIVKDDYGKYQSYINPEMVKTLQEKKVLEEQLRNLKQPFHDLKQLKDNFIQYNLVAQNIEEVTEDEKVIKHFSGEEAIEYSKGIENKFKEIEQSRENIENHMKK